MVDATAWLPHHHLHTCIPLALPNTSWKLLIVKAVMGHRVVKLDTAGLLRKVLCCG